jgi:hypothetical protein
MAVRRGTRRPEDHRRGTGAGAAIGLEHHSL